MMVLDFLLLSDRLLAVCGYAASALIGRNLVACIMFFFATVDVCACILFIAFLDTRKLWLRF
jgi:uncharacterized RDD family membrane protein YckC